MVAGLIVFSWLSEFLVEQCTESTLIYTGLPLIGLSRIILNFPSLFELFKFICH